MAASAIAQSDPAVIAKAAQRVEAVGPTLPGAPAWARAFGVAAVVTYVGGLGAIYLGKHHMYYQPDRTEVAPISVGLTTARVQPIITSDRERLIVWAAPAAKGMPTVMFFHGQDGNLATRREKFAAYTHEGFGLYAVSTRGYGGSSGQPSEQGAAIDALSAFAALTDTGVKASDIFLHGEGIGAYSVAAIAGQKPVAGAIFDSAPASMRDVAARKLPMFPVARLLDETYNVAGLTQRVNAPLLVVHGGADKTVTPDMAYANFFAAGGSARITVLNGAEAKDLWARGAFATISTWITQRRAGRL